jgi:peptidoglycan/LPS O-acetylase OafA/YrhL
MTIKTASSSRIAGLDTLRALAIVCVMAYHLNGRLPDGFAISGRFGWMGVDLFFILSGFLIGSQLLMDSPFRGALDGWAWICSSF